MPPRIRLSFAAMSLTLFVLAAIPIYTGLVSRGDIWWTPRPLLVPLGESVDRVEIYARGEPLSALLRAGRVRVVDGGDATVLTADEVGLRFNNWDRVRAEREPALLVAAAACGVAALLFILIVTDRLAYRPERPAA